MNNVAKKRSILCAIIISSVNGRIFRNEVIVGRQSRLQNSHRDNGAVVMWESQGDWGRPGLTSETTSNMFSGRKHKDDAINEGVCSIDRTQ